MKNIYQGKLALITGGSSGIGFEVVKNLYNQGCSIIILARNKEKLDFAENLLTSQNNNLEQYVWTYSVDVADFEKVQAVADKIISSAGIPDFIFNCAGVARPGYVEELPIEVYKWTMDIDYHGTVNVTKAFLPALIKRGSGHIINVSSMAGVIGAFGYTAYSGAKFAVRGFTDTLRAELKCKDINVSIVFPPDTDTPQLAWETQYKPAETAILAGSDRPLSAATVAEVILRDVAKNKYVIVPGTNAKLMYALASHLGGLIYPIMDMLVMDAKRKCSPTRKH
ncbi:MAG TPA: SDR family oxidoreductase [Anaerolineaceae bacterium]|nr:SDR family oxidoreductase [Anaerolineaceae bacterium]